MGLDAAVLENVERMNYSTPTPIQRYAVPVIRGGRDLMACAQTGSGKTLAFVLPIITGITGEGLVAAEVGRAAPAALILSPTRELAIQISNHVRHFCRGTQVKSFCAYGGTSVRYNATQLEKGDVSVLIATPGR